MQRLRTKFLSPLWMVECHGGEIFQNATLTEASAVIGYFPDVPVKLLKARYANMKAKTRVWSGADVRLTSGLADFRTLG